MKLSGCRSPIKVILFALATQMIAVILIFKYYISVDGFGGDQFVRDFIGIGAIIGLFVLIPSVAIGAFQRQNKANDN